VGCRGMRKDKDTEKSLGWMDYMPLMGNVSSELFHTFISCVSTRN
jgi:hypothetical protein